VETQLKVSSINAVEPNLSPPDSAFVFMPKNADVEIVLIHKVIRSTHTPSSKHMKEKAKLFT